jgi:hypothetical protein
MLKKKVRKELEQIKNGSLEFTLPIGVKVIDSEAKAQEYLKVLQSQQESTNEVDEVEQAYFRSWEKFHNDIEWKLADAWTSSFFINKDSANKIYPTNETLYLIETGHEIDATLEKEIINLSAKYNFFHWHLEFRDVFEKGGFDCILGNPPWEKIKLHEKEFFASRSIKIANATNASIRKKLIEELQKQNPQLHIEFEEAKSKSENESKFIRNSERFPLTAVGDINTYSIFSELARTLVNGYGIAGIIVPTGIATDDTTKDFFADLVDKESIISLFDFTNQESFFPAVDSNTKFCLLTLCGNQLKTISKFVFFAKKIEQVLDDYFLITLSKKDILLINPNTRNCPIFRTRADAEITKNIYNKVPVLIKEADGSNNWGIDFMRMYDMSNDSHLFIKPEDVDNDADNSFTFV